MSFRDPSKYKEFPGQDNILVENGELVCVIGPQGKGWITLSNVIIYNREDAIAYATKLNSLIKFNRQRVAKQKVKY